MLLLSLSTAQSAKECQDQDQQCSAWAAAGECVDNPVFMMEKCPRSCCGMEWPCVKGIAPSTKGDLRCKDSDNQCANWASQGECVENPLFMVQTCPQACCGHCRAHEEVEGLPLRQIAVVNSFLWAWKGYKDHAWGKDMLRPVSKTSMAWLGDLGLTLIDSMSTLIMIRKSTCQASKQAMHGRYCQMLTDAEKDGHKWISDNFSNQVEKGPSVNVFETTIRILGGLLSAFALTDDNMYLEKATLIGDRLLPAFNSKSGVPFADVALKSGVSKNPTACLAEASTVQLEFKYLSHLTKDPKYWNAVDKVNQVLQSNLEAQWEGLPPLWVDTATGKYKGGEVSLGARGDSYYEYLLKQYLFTSKTEPHFWNHYEFAIKGIKKNLIKRTGPVGAGLMYIAEYTDSRQLKHKMDHLACFAAGMFALGAVESPPEYTGKKEDMDIAQGLAETCFQLYQRSPSGVAPEIATFMQGSPDFKVADGYEASNFLRPETVESMHLMRDITGDAHYVDKAWDIYKKWEKFSFVESGGYACLQGVKQPIPTKDDKMESFFISESLKYLMMSFDPKPDKDFLKKWVFNTEAHPLPIIPKKPF